MRGASTFRVGQRVLWKNSVETRERGHPAWQLAIAALAFEAQIRLKEQRENLGVAATSLALHFGAPRQPVIETSEQIVDADEIRGRRAAHADVGLDELLR